MSLIRFPIVGVGRSDPLREVWLDTTTDDTNVWTFTELEWSKKETLSGCALASLSGAYSAIVRGYAKSATGSFSYEICGWAKGCSPKHSLIVGRDPADITIAPEGEVLAAGVWSFNSSYATTKHPVYETATDAWMYAYTVTQTTADTDVIAAYTGAAGNTLARLKLLNLQDYAYLGCHVYSFSTITRAMLVLSVL